MNTELLERTCKLAEKQLEKIVESAERDGKMPIQDAEYVNYLTHTIKSIKTTMAMEGEYGTSERRGRSPMTGRYVSRDGGSYDGGSYEGTMSGYPMRYAYDGGSMRGSYDSYDRSMHGDREKLEKLMNETSDERVKHALKEAMRNL